MEPVHTPPTTEPEKTGPAVRRWLRVYSLELAVGLGAGLGLFLLLLLLLELGLPSGTGLGELIRARQDSRQAATRLDFDAADGEMVAVLSDVRRTVRDKPASSVVWNAASPGTALGDRHAIQSDRDSGATIRFGDDSLLELGESSIVVIRKPRRVTGSLRRRAAVLFMDGFVRGRLGGGSDGVELEVIAGEGTVRAVGDGDGEAEVELAMDQGKSAISVRGGSAELVWKDKVVTVPSGHMITYEADRPPDTPVMLPRPPRQLGPIDGAGYRYRQTPPRVSFEWLSVEDSSGFRLQIARDPDFGRLVYDERHDGNGFVHGNLEAGEYYWRVFTYKGPMASPPSPTRRLVIQRDRVAPRLAVQVPSGTVTSDRLVVRGVTEPGCRIVIGDRSISVDADGTFEHDHTLQPGYNFLVVQAIDATGNTAFSNHTILADLGSPETAP